MNKLLSALKRTPYSYKYNLRAFSTQKDEINFIKDPTSSNYRSALKHKADRDDQYTSDNHSLLPYLYMYPFNQDNIGYVLLEPRTRALIAVDVGDYEASKKVIEELEKTQKAELRYVLSTHHHGDHIGGNSQWKKERGTRVQVISGSVRPDRIEADTRLNDLQTIEIGDLCVCCMETPGHTQEHVSFIVTHVTPDSTKTPLLFCGDTLFIGGCGRLLDSQHCQAETLFYTLQKLINLPNETLVLCGHEYTLSNLKFAKYIEPDNPMIDLKIKQVEKARQAGDYTVPSKLMDERLYNPFIRCAKEPYFKDITGENDPVRIFAKLRKLKDNFKAAN